MYLWHAKHYKTYPMLYALTYPFVTGIHSPALNFCLPELTYIKTLSSIWRDYWSPRTRRKLTYFMNLIVGFSLWTAYGIHYFMLISPRFRQNIWSKCRHVACKNLSYEYEYRSLLFQIITAWSRNWLYDLCRGYDPEPVTVRQIPQSIGCSKNFPGRSALATIETTRQWLCSLASELVERLEADRGEYRRQASRLTLHVRTDAPLSNGSFSRVLPSVLLASIGVPDSQDPAEQSISRNESQKPKTRHEERIAEAALRVLRDQVECNETLDTWWAYSTVIILHRVFDCLVFYALLDFVQSLTDFTRNVYQVRISWDVLLHSSLLFDWIRLVWNPCFVGLFWSYGLYSRWSDWG